MQILLETLLPDVSATNEPKRQQCGAPDYILTRKDIPVGFIEAKDIGDADLAGVKKTGNKEQFDRYKASLNNLIFTDYLDFHFYKDGQFISSIKIAELVPFSLGEGLGVRSFPQNFATFKNLLSNFSLEVTQSIKSSKKLAEMMAAKARLLSDVIEKALTSDETNQQDSTLKDQMNAFRQILIHDITPKGFADVYAQTIAYGMFAARLHDPTLPTFSRQEAAELIPKSNPFLRKLFGYIAGPDIDDRIKWIVDGLVEIFLACNVEEILKGYGKTTKTEDPIIHFYETFLSAYDPALRKARGVWYTPAPVVNFIVRAVDDILKTEFNLPQGLADNSKTKIKVNGYGLKPVEKEVHKVQILDPATGTGTFLAEVVKHIHKKFARQQGIWSNYVETHLLPRLNGFELLMASYAMAHLQMDLLLKETGYIPLSFGEGLGVRSAQRLRIYLTNSLEESHPDTGTLFANWLSTEANEANQIKRDTPVMCVIGNPPYSISTTNKSKWIEDLIIDYKKNLNERKINLDDDYIKFIRYGQHFIDKNGSGVLAYISNNSFIDGVTHRQMRKNLLESFDKIYILDLHGNARKQEVCLDGSPDNNVFDIMQGVSVNIFIKTGKKKQSELGQVFHCDIQGKREMKYDFLNSNNINSINWFKLSFNNQYYFFVPKNFKSQEIYDQGVKINILFSKYSAGIKTKVDHIAIDFEKGSLAKRVDDIISNKLNFEQIRSKYELSIKTTWEYKSINNLVFNKEKIIKYEYRPFDYRYTYYDDKFLSRSRSEVMNNFVNDDNIGLENSRNGDHLFVGKYISDEHFISDNSFKFPLYTYSKTNAQQTTDQTNKRIPNLNTEIVNQIAKNLGLTFVPEKTTPPVGHPSVGGEFAPIDILDYIYAVLHSPGYREKYKEFLKIDFPRVPYPKAPSPSERAGGEVFWQLVKLGSQLRQIHLLEAEVVENYITQYPVDGDNVVTKIKFEVYNYIHEMPDENGNFNYSDYKGLVFINDTQYFKDVPTSAWEFYIGGYQPAQKWLKDRKGRALEFEDILHYQKIIVALSETGRLMKEIDGIEIE